MCIASASWPASRRASIVLVALGLLLARAAPAQIAPSGCAFGTVEVVPDAALPLVGIAPTADDLFRIDWDPAADAARFGLAALRPRRLMGSDGDGMLTLPAL